MYIAHGLSLGSTIFYCTKRYARLADGNVGNFQKVTQEKCNGSTLMRGLITHSALQGYPTTSIRRCGISVPRFVFFMAFMVLKGAKKTNMKKLLFLPAVLLTINCFSEVYTVDFEPKCSSNHIQMSDEQIYQALDSLKNLFHYEIKEFNSSYCKPKFPSKSAYTEYSNAIQHLNNRAYIWPRLEIIDKKEKYSRISSSSILEYLFDTVRYEIKIKPQATAENDFSMSDEQIYQALDSLKNLYSYNPPAYSLNIVPNYKSEKPEIEYMDGIKMLKNGRYIWSRLEIINKRGDYFLNSESSLLKYLFDTAQYEIKIKPQKEIDYTYKSHQSDVGFSSIDGCFYVKRTNTGKIILMVEHADSRFREAKLVKHGNCSYDLQYSSIMLKMKDGTTKTLNNINPLHEIDTRHLFTDQFDITSVKVADIVKIRLIDFTDKYDYNSKYIGEMISLMQSAAIKNYKESKAQDEF